MDGVSRKRSGVVTKVRKAVIPAAGLGTRFLPATKSQPKEMLPVVDKPAIQYVVEEAVRAGLTDILIITGRNKRAIEDHFDRNFELEHFLERSGKDDLLKEVRFASDLADIHYVRQRDPLGLGHAVSVARHHVGNEPFAVLLADDLMIDDGALLRSMLDVHEQQDRSCIAFLEVSPEESASYRCLRPMPRAATLGRDLRVGVIAVVAAHATILDAVAPLPPRSFARRDARGLVLAEDVVARERVPPFANTGMDGYAVRAVDTPGSLRVIGELTAGRAPTIAVGS